MELRAHCTHYSERSSETQLPAHLLQNTTSDLLSHSLRCGVAQDLWHAHCLQNRCPVTAHWKDLSMVSWTWRHGTLYQAQGYPFYVRASSESCDLCTAGGLTWVRWNPGIITGDEKPKPSIWYHAGLKANRRWCERINRERNCLCWYFKASATSGIWFHKGYSSKK